MEKIATNRKAYFEYYIVEKLIAGVELKGSEVKSIRKGEVNISEAYCLIDNGEMFLKNMHVSEHKQGGIHNNHEPLRTRKLLLKKKEILKLAEEVKLKGLTIVPLEIILTGFGYIKLEIGLAKGKKNYDKRESIKQKDLKRANEL
jgi:SsrA-binding protein